MATEFQVESVGVRSAPQQPRAIPTGQAQIQALLLGVILRGWLTDQEQFFLDQLAPDHCLSFMLSNRRYVHPQDIELFPAAALCASLGRSDDQIYSQLLPNLGKSNAPCYTVFTAAVNPGSRSPLVLGMLGPDFGDQMFDNGDRFRRLIDEWRAAHTTIQPLAESLRTELAAAGPVLLVERSSGRVIAANNSMTALAGKPEKELVDLEYGQIQNLLADRISGRKLTMSRFDVGDLQVMVVVMGQTAADATDITPIPGEHLIHKLNNHVTCLMAAASFLADTSEGKDTEERELTDVIQRESAGLAAQIERLDLMLNYHALITREVQIRSEIERAVNRFRQTQGSAKSIDCRITFAPGTTRLPGRALSSLIETIFLAQLATGDRKARTVLDTGTDEHGSVLTIETDYTHSDQTAQFHLDWLGCARRLATQMLPTVRMEQLQTKRKLLTRLTIQETDTDRYQQ